jgi:hypothetical protein
MQKEENLYHFSGPAKVLRVQEGIQGKVEGKKAPCQA